MNKPTESSTNTKKDNTTPTTPSPKPFNSLEIYQNTLKDLVRMAQLRGWKEYTWDQVQKLNADTSGLFTGIKDDFMEAMKNAKKGKT